jgi:hypothetical protein
MERKQYRKREGEDRVNQYEQGEHCNGYSLKEASFSESTVMGAVMAG